MSQSSLYTTLPSTKSIRLLRLHPGAEDETVSCSLELIEDFRSSPQYHALSYCWGDENDLTELSCNGEASAVINNLYAALHRLRQRKQSTLVWADAICINQESIFERNQQVSIMNKIYFHASRASYGLVPAMRTTDFTHAEWQSFYDFYQADWFFRVWVVQEVLQISDVCLLCSKFEIEWNFIALSASWAWLGAIQDYSTHFKKEYFPSYNGFINANFMWDQTLATRRQAPFLALLHLSRPFQSTDPRDKVFAMLHHCINQNVISERGQLIETRLYPSCSPNVSTYRTPG
ncbi:uncharacterized protein K460DRAFT_282392 [Cucurbitaria berberidis CBS 394.84]|uniref:Heterokaryon incompatibility domain-containing protein n=1 Tax=Cucurbitaria berberidis CBS 394.84 TaxID=1168544 RepID=A0A9P4L7M4_9PLEO|nr:uncharacterized protein K460DRAFT_282392 [Cucurbitaria berberidis CBS 394.84]KAF1844477.1 hypothetical protein K460DRAFT_282392 [Cucurbitaria berberidis CBS 394.84]